MYCTLQYAILYLTSSFGHALFAGLLNDYTVHIRDA